MKKIILASLLFLISIGISAQEAKVIKEGGKVTKEQVEKNKSKLEKKKAEHNKKVAKAKKEHDKKVEEAKANAKVLVETAKKEAVLLADKVTNDTNTEIENLEKAFEDRVNIERRQMQRAVVGEVLEGMFKEGSISLDNDEIVKIINKKVA